MACCWLRKRVCAFSPKTKPERRKPSPPFLASINILGLRCTTLALLASSQISVQHRKWASNSSRELSANQRAAPQVGLPRVDKYAVQPNSLYRTAIGCMKGFVLGIVLLTCGAFRNWLQDTFAYLCSTWAFDLNALLAIGCIALAGLIYRSLAKAIFMEQVEPKMVPARRKKRNLASGSLLAAMMVLGSPNRAKGFQCQTDSVASWNYSLTPIPHMSLSGLEFTCDDKINRTLDNVRVWMEVGGDIECSGEPWYCESVRNEIVSMLGPPRSQGLVENNDLLLGGERKDLATNRTVSTKMELPEKEWQQVLVFFICFIGIGALLEVFLIVFMSRSLTSMLRKREHGEALVPLPDAPEDEHSVALLDHGMPESSSRVLFLKTSQDSIFSSPNVPMHAKILVPFFLALAIGTFIIANFSVGAAVEMIVDYTHKKSWMPWKHGKVTDRYGPYSLFEFNLGNTITEMYKAKVYVLSLLVLVWSGIWPYLKLVLLLLAWFIPPRYLTATTRGRMLLVFDSLGKWCMIDVFLMLLMSEAFRFYIDTKSIPIGKLLLGSSVTLDVSVLSGLGMFGFTLAAMLSLLMNHVVLAYHRTAESLEVSKLIQEQLQVRREESIGDMQIEDTPKPPRFCCPCPTGSWFGVGSAEITDSQLEFVLNRKEAISSHTFQMPDGKKRRIGNLTLAVVAVLLVASMTLIVAGAFTESFEFTFTGFAGDLIKKFQPESSVRTYSLISIAQALNPGNQTLAPPNLTGVAFLQTIYLLFAFVMPLVMCIFSLALWLIPMRLRDQKIVFDCCEIISSWSALDCFIVSIIAACVEINQFAQFLIGDKCEPLEKRFHIDQCFGITTSFLPGCWVIVAAASLLFLSSQLVLRICEKVIYDREFDVIELQNEDMQRGQRQTPSGLISSILVET